MPLADRLVQLLPSLEKEMLALPHFVSRGDTCIDVGASYGTYAVALARGVGPGGRVHAFEPRLRSRAVLRAVAGAFAPGIIEVHPVAVAATPRRDVLVTPRRRAFLPVPGRSFLRADGNADLQEFTSAAQREVTTVTLDGFVAERGIGRVSFVKIDVEGAEAEVLAGGRRTLREHRPTLLCEIEDRHTRRYGRSAQDLLEQLTSSGYCAYIWRQRALRRVTSVDPSENNYLFVPTEGGNGHRHGEDPR